MDSLLSNPAVLGVAIAGALLVLILIWKILKGIVKITVMVMLFAVVGFAVYRLSELGMLPF
ncbi:MAG TPA: hypothetical protein EYQ64_04925 [Gemmatimonadetes bacterium]|nr:hypothetical protein [Gemmatimonadota bacterium]